MDPQMELSKTIATVNNLILAYELQEQELVTVDVLGSLFAIRDQLSRVGEAVDYLY